MGTKNSPDDFDCEDKALPDEPRFTLLARDRHAPDAVEKWADGRELEIRRGYSGNKKKVAEELVQLSHARKCAEDMRNWRRGNMGAWKGASSSLSPSSSQEITKKKTPETPWETRKALSPGTPFLLTGAEEFDERRRVAELGEFKVVSSLTE